MASKGLFEQLQQLIAPPVFADDEDKTRLAAMFNVVMFGLLAASFAFIVFSLLIFHNLIAPVIFIVMLLARQIAMVLMRRGYVQLTGALLVSFLWIIFVFLTVASGGVDSSHYISFITVILIAGLMLSGQVALIFAGLSVFAGLVMLLAEQNGLFPAALIPVTPFSAWISVSANFILGALFLYLAVENMRAALERARRNEHDLQLKVFETRQLMQEIQDAYEYKSRLVARVNHELRTPLGSTLGMAELLKYGVYGSLTPEQTEAAQKIINNAQRLERIINEMLEHSRIESGQLSQEIVSFPIAGLIQGLQATFDPLAQEKGLEFTLELDGDMPETITGPQDGIIQALSSLLDNAFKFTESGAVRVRFFRQDAEHWAFSVTDSGAGIPSAAQAYIFEPFRQMDESATRKHGGIGLGLTIVKQLVDEMGGQITLRSQVGQGSTFTVSLPFQPQGVAP